MHGIYAHARVSDLFLLFAPHNRMKLAISLRVGCSGVKQVPVSEPNVMDQSLTKNTTFRLTYLAQL